MNVALEQQEGLKFEETKELHGHLESCLGVIDDLSFAAMFENGNMAQAGTVQINLIETMSEISTHIIEMDLFHKKEIHYNGNILPSSKKKNIVVIVPSNFVRVLIHLLNNAVKFANVGGKIDVNIFEEDDSNDNTGKAAEDNHVTTEHPKKTFVFQFINSVANRVNEEQIHKCFQRYYHQTPTPNVSPNSSNQNLLDLSASSRSMTTTESNEQEHLSQTLSSTDGLGLGLFVSYNIIQLMGGLLECHANEKEVIFSFKLSLDVIEQKTTNYKNPSPKGINLMKSNHPRARIIDSPVAHSHLNRVITSSEGVVVEETDIEKMLSDKTENVRCPLSTITCIGLNKRISIYTSITPSLKNWESLQDRTGKTPRNFYHQKRILIVDDSSICQKVMTKALTTDGYEVDCVSNGKEACETLAIEPCIYAAVLMDLRMPIMDGLTATRECRKKPHLAHLPIIVVTAEIGAEIEKQAHECGASHFMQKPAKLSELRIFLQYHASNT